MSHPLNNSALLKCLLVIPQPAHKAYLESLKTTFGNFKATLPIPSLVVSLIHRTTFIAVNELFMGRGASLNSVLSEVCQDRAVLAAVLEEQVVGLADFSMKEGAIDLLTTLLHECAEIYGTQMPMRHVRSVKHCFIELTA